MSAAPPASPDRRSIGAIAAAWLAAMLIGLGAAGEALDRIAFDLLLAAQPPQIDDSPVVIVAIDEPSFAELGLQWPWPRHVHAQLVDRLAGAGANMIAFDVLFTEAAGEPEDDRRFAAALARAGNVVLGADVALTQGAGFTHFQQIEPIEPLRVAAAATGRVGLDLDPDGVQRRVPQDREGLARQILDRAGIPVAGFPPSARIRYAGPPGTFRHVSYYQALDPETHLPAGALRDRIVLVGLAVRAAASVDRLGVDQLRTPFFRSSGQISSGVEAHANVLDSLRRGDVVQVAALPAQLASYAVLAFALAGLGRTWRPIRSAVLGAGASAAMLASTAVLLHSGDLWLPLAGPCIGIWLAWLAQGGIAFLREQRQRRYLREAFGKYLSSTVIEDLIADPSHLNLGGERCVATILVTDLANFTGLTEALDAPTLVRTLQDYFGGLCRIVLDHSGTIAGMGGDSLIVLFNAPAGQADHACRAVTCALAIDDWSQDFCRHQHLPVAFGPTRVGVATGEVIVGNFGGRDWFHYTAMGDPVNQAARLEGANKYFGTRLCVSGETARTCPDHSFRPIAEVILKGKQEAIPVLEPVRADVARAQAQGLAAYRQAWALLAAGDPDAASALREVLARDPDDPLPRFHLARLARGERGVCIAFAEK